ncbi:hypothetical protein B0H10DRAFT_2083632 [Mycena sp. CBHHK59/15]|nr:hypothetical protein B0H10DRAFT_2083632 [Mycena sp. CBHHK59/15]
MRSAFESHSAASCTTPACSVPRPLLYALVHSLNANPKHLVGPRRHPRACGTPLLYPPPPSRRHPSAQRRGTIASSSAYPARNLRDHRPSDAHSIPHACPSDRLSLRSAYTHIDGRSSRPGLSRGANPRERCGPLRTRRTISQRLGRVRDIPEHGDGSRQERRR